MNQKKPLLTKYQTQIQSIIIRNLKSLIIVKYYNILKI